jgi:hypothetical protein
LGVPAAIMEYIYNVAIFNEKDLLNQFELKFNTDTKNSENSKKELNTNLGPYLANPYYKENLLQKENAEKARQKLFLDKLNQMQLSVIDCEEKLAEEFVKRVNNNFEALMLLFDNFIFEEEFVALGDEEYFKERKDYNELNKLKVENRSGLNMDSKRTFKKIYLGIDKSKLKINYYEKFNAFVVGLIQCI